MKLELSLYDCDTMALKILLFSLFSPLCLNIERVLNRRLFFSFSFFFQQETQRFFLGLN